jgi:multimeric flavodoxin WrbA
MGIIEGVRDFGMLMRCKPCKHCKHCRSRNCQKKRVAWVKTDEMQHIMNEYISLDISVLTLFSTHIYL